MFSKFGKFGAVKLKNIRTKDFKVHFNNFIPHNKFLVRILLTNKLLTQLFEWIDFNLRNNRINSLKFFVLIFYNYTAPNLSSYMKTINI